MSLTGPVLLVVVCGARPLHCGRAIYFRRPEMALNDLALHTPTGPIEGTRMTSPPLILDRFGAHHRPLVGARFRLDPETARRLDASTSRWRARAVSSPARPREQAADSESRWL